MKTVMQAAVEEFDNQDPNKPYTAQEVTNILVELLEQERKQIEVAYDNGWGIGFQKRNFDSGEKYFNNTYNNQ